MEVSCLWSWGLCMGMWYMCVKCKRTYNVQGNSCDLVSAAMVGAILCPTDVYLKWSFFSDCFSHSAPSAE
jgi:hypothetical protein